MFNTQRWRASLVWLLHNLLRAIQCMQCNFLFSSAHEGSFNKNGRGLAKVGVITQNFSARSARTILKEPPFLNSWIRPCIIIYCVSALSLH